jgi:tungstate transport system substrate-binding protein
MGDISQARRPGRMPGLGAARTLAIALGTIGAITLTGMVGLLAVAPGPGAVPMLLATTTSTRDTGLLDHLAPLVRESLGIDLRYVAVGTGQALEYGRRCDADVVMVHSPPAEQAFMDQGYGEERREVFYNEFLLVGPPADPAALHGAADAAAALQKVQSTQSRFASRGDSSGTHAAERRLWELAGFDYERDIDARGNAWYVNVSGGMLVTLQRASELAAYTLADSGTWYAHESSLDLALHVDRDPTLKNQYSVLTLSRSNCPRVNHAAAGSFQSWLASPAGQDAAGAFEVDGKQLFHPNAKPWDREG